MALSFGNCTYNNPTVQAVLFDGTEAMAKEVKEELVGAGYPAALKIDKIEPSVKIKVVTKINNSTVYLQDGEYLIKIGPIGPRYIVVSSSGFNAVFTLE